MSSEPDRVSREKALLIGHEFNSTILCVFLWGIYTVVYAGTLYLYLTKKSSKNKVILWGISLSYSAYSALAILNWYHDQSAVVNHSETRDALYAALFLGSRWPVLVSDIMISVLAAVADGILIWRCYHVFGHSFRAILFPGFLLFCEIVVDLIILSVWGVYHLDPSDSQSSVLNQLIAAQAFITFAATLASTTLIAYQIYTATREIPGNSKRLPVRILEILVQSAAAYSLVAIAYAISGVVPQTVSNGVSWIAAGDYTTVLFIFTSGVAPIVLVARVAILDENDVYASSAAPASGSSRLSGLRFHVRTTRGDAESQPQVSDRISRVNRSVEGPQVPKAEKEKGDIVNIS